MHTFKKISAALRTAKLLHILPAVIRDAAWPLHFKFASYAYAVVWQLKTQDNFYGQGRVRNKGESNCQSPPLDTASLPQEMETEQQLTVVRILVITTYTVSGSSLADP